jgi:hypothetical protein
MLKPTGVATIFIILVTKVTMQAAFLAYYLNKHDCKEECPDNHSLPLPQL